MKNKLGMEMKEVCFKVLVNGRKVKEEKEEEMGIIFNNSDLDKITKLLSDNNIEFKPHKFRDKKETANVQ